LGLAGGFSFVNEGMLVPVVKESDGIIPVPPQTTGVELARDEDDTKQ
jgi:hypothetical protein